MSKTPKQEALTAVSKLAGQVDRAKNRLLDLQGARDWAILKAQAQGATYPELAAMSGLSQARVKQVLTDMRAANPTTTQE